jgi:hypothetical protein
MAGGKGAKTVSLTFFAKTLTLSAAKSHICKVFQSSTLKYRKKLFPGGDK